VLGCFLLCEITFGQTAPTKQTVSANPTERPDKGKLSATPLDKAPKKSTIEVRHLEKLVDGLKVAETAHFRVLHDQKLPIVEKIAETAEETRDRLQKKWFGDVGTDWDGKCSIYLHPDRDNYAAKTKMKNTLGHMRTLDWGGVFLRSIHVPCKQANLVEDVLPHEVSHSVMAVRFQGKLPRWADEGMAMLAESPASVAECVGRLPGYRKNDGLFALEVLTQTEEPEHFNTMEYYAQSTSLVQFLSTRKDPQTFTQFLRTCASKGPAVALGRHYGMDGFGELERQWQAFAFKKK